nr:hypothetical protein [Tanacetum cinerariifolium]
MVGRGEAYGTIQVSMSVQEGSCGGDTVLGEKIGLGPLQINHHYCYGFGDPLEGIFCHKCTCELCGNGAHYGYNCPPKVPIIPNPEPFINQTIKELQPTVQSFDPKSDLVYNSPNVFDPPPQLPFYSYEFCRNDARYSHYYTPQQVLCCENYGVTHEAYQCQPKNEDYYHEQNSCYDNNSFGFDQFQPQQYTVNHPVFNVQNDLFDSQNKLMEQLTSMCDMIPACYDDDDDDYAFAITPNEPINSLSMGGEHLDTISETESNEFIKSSVENLVPIPSESEGESKYFPKEIYSNPLFDEEIIKIDPHPFNAESDHIEPLLDYDSSIISSSKIDSLLDEFAGELTLLKSISLGIDETDCYLEEETHFVKRLLYDNSSPRPPEEFVFENSDAEIESFSSFPFPVEDSDSLIEETDLSFTPDYPMPPGIKDDDYESEKDIFILEDLLNNDSLSIPENESFHFDIPSFFRPPAKPPDGNTGILNVKMMGDISKQKVPMPRLMITIVSDQEKSSDLLSHQGLEAFQPSTECPMMIHEKNSHILDVPLFYFYPP